MNRIATFIYLLLFLLQVVKQQYRTVNRIPVAEVGNTVLYYDEIPELTTSWCK